MKIISVLLPKLMKYRSFRLIMARTYPVLKKSGILGLLQKLNNGSMSDPYDHADSGKKGLMRTYDLVNFDAAGALKKYSVKATDLIKSDREYKLGLLVDDDIEFNDLESACKALKIRYVIYDIKDPGLPEKLINTDCDGILILPYSNSIVFRAFQEVTQILASETNLRIYPTLRELSFYESKLILANFLKLNNIPHPPTTVFYDYPRVKAFLETCQYPVVFKTSAGASASGVEILRNKRQAIKLAKQLFHKYYLRKFETERRDLVWGYMLLQEYVDEAKEFRVIKSGDSWFGYQKWKEPHQVFLSGSGLCRYTVSPSEDLLDFCKALADKYRFTTMCFDVFENKKGEYLVNELQTWFGSYDPAEMYVNNVPGRYRFIGGKWIFEPGFFNVYGTNLLRIAHFISLLQEHNQIKSDHVPREVTAEIIQ